MDTKKIVDIIALVLVIIGGLLWGLYGVANMNLIDQLFGAGSIVAMVVYVLVALAALYTIMILLEKTKK